MTPPAHRPLALLLVAALASPLFAQEYVDDDAPNDPGPGDPTISDPLANGTPEHPFDRLQQAIAVSPANGEIIIKPGRYTGQGNSDVQLDKSLLIRPERGADETIFDMRAASSFLTIGAGHYTILRGLTIENGVGFEAGAVLTGPDGETFVEHCILRRNRATSNGVAGGAITAVGSIEIHGCAFLANQTAGGHLARRRHRAAGAGRIQLRPRDHALDQVAR